MAYNHVGGGYYRIYNPNVYYKAEFFGPIMNPAPYYATSGYGTSMYRRQTLASRSVTKEFEKYSIRDEHNKRSTFLPENFSLSPLSLAILYMDDGSLSHNDAQRDRAVFNICSVGDSEINRDRFDAAMCQMGLVGVWRSSATRGKQYWKYYLNTDSSWLLFTIIRPYVPFCMQYKLPEELRGLNIATLNLTGINSPSAGLMTGTLTAGATTNIACMAVQNISNSGKNVINCSGRDPGDATKLFNFLLVSK
jgi:hypothetical protein